MLDEQEEIVIGEFACPVFFNPKVIPSRGYVASVLSYELDEVVPVFGDDRLLASVFHYCEPVLEDSLVRLSPASRAQWPKCSFCRIDTLLARCLSRVVAVLGKALPSLRVFCLNRPSKASRVVRPIRHPRQPGRHLCMEADRLWMNVRDIRD